MKTELQCDATLTQELLRLCQSALARGQLAVAEHLLRAIEEMARASPALAEFEEEAYLGIATSKGLNSPRSARTKRS